MPTIDPQQSIDLGSCTGHPMPSLSDVDVPDGHSASSGTSAFKVHLQGLTQEHENLQARCEELLLQLQQFQGGGPAANLEVVNPDEGRPSQKNHHNRLSHCTPRIQDDVEMVQIVAEAAASSVSSHHDSKHTSRVAAYHSEESQSQQNVPIERGATEKVSVRDNVSVWESSSHHFQHYDSGRTGSSDASRTVGKALSRFYSSRSPHHRSSMNKSSTDGVRTRSDAMVREMLPEFVISQHLDAGQSVGTPSTMRNSRTRLIRIDCGVLMPASLTRLTWDFCVFLILLFELWAAPFELGFCEPEAIPDSFITLSYVVTGLFAVDILMNFNTGYFQKGQAVMQRTLIAQHYLKFWFWIDAISTVPWHLAASHFFRLSRFGKLTRVTRVLRYLKFARSIHLVQTMNEVGCIRWLHLTFPSLYFSSIINAVLFIIVFAHVHGCVWAVMHSGWLPKDDFKEAVESYGDCFYWAFVALTTGKLSSPVPGGEISPHQPLGVWILELWVAAVRLGLAAVMVIWGVCQAHIKYHDRIRLKKLKGDALEYLKQHKVSFATQVELLFILHETGSVRQLKQRFRDLVDNDIPVEVKQRVTSELWAHRLRSFGLIDAVRRHHHHFLTELSLVVREEVFASKFAVFHAGDASIAAYHVMDGVLVTAGDDKVPAYGEGQWIGETALVNPLLRRRTTIVTTAITALMSVPAEGFHDLLARHHLQEQFQHICQENLWKGLCGRCGALGDHNANDCPYVDWENASLPTRHHTSFFGRTFTHRGSLGSRRSGGSNVTAKTSDQQLQKTGSLPMRAVRTGSMTMGHFLTRASNRSLKKGVSRDLQQFLTLNHLERIIPTMTELGVLNLEDLQKMSVDELSDMLTDNGDHLTKSELDVFSIRHIEAFRAKAANTVLQHLFAPSDFHYIFLSHFKLEAGTEAALMQQELEKIISDDPTFLGAGHFDVPIFLDSENLNSLKDLQAAVNKTHNLVVLLTAGVLTRPWVLVEIVTAIRSKRVKIVPVKVTKAGAEFRFPDEKFYEQLSNQKFISSDGTHVLEDCGISMMEVEACLREMLKEIAETYSPHRSADFRETELRAILKRCQVTTQAHHRSASK